MIEIGSPTSPPDVSALPAAAALPFRYVISGLRVGSGIALPSAIPEGEREGAVDVVMRSGDVPADLPGAERGGRDWQAAQGAFLLRIPGVARFLIDGGREVVFAAEPGSDPNDVALYLLGTCFAILLGQRGRLVLHASAVVVADGAMLFCGPSGSGKSTMAATLCQRGYPLLNDDVCSLSPGEDGRFLVHPDGRMLKLWTASIEYLQQGDEATVPVRAGFDKFYSAPVAAARSPRPVHGIYMLSAVPDEVAPALRRLSLAEGTSAIQSNAFRPELVHAMGQTASYFAAAAALQKTAAIYELCRPMRFGSAGRTLDLLETHWAAATPRPFQQQISSLGQGRGE